MESLPVGPRSSRRYVAESNAAANSEGQHEVLFVVGQPPVAVELGVDRVVEAPTWVHDALSERRGPSHLPIPLVDRRRERQLSADDNFQRGTGRKQARPRDTGAG